MRFRSKSQFTPILQRLKNLGSRWRSFVNESEFIWGSIWKYRRMAGWGILFLVLVDFLEVIPPFLMKEAIDVLGQSISGGESVKTRLLELGLFYIGVSLAQAVGRYGWRVFLIRCSMAAGRDFRETFFHHLLKLSPSFFDRKKVGELMSLATNDTDAMRLAISAILVFLVDALFYFITVPVAMYLLSPKLTWVAFAPLPLIPLIVIYFEDAIHKRFEKVQEAFARLASLAQEGLAGFKVIKAYNRQGRMRDRFETTSQDYLTDNLNLVSVQSWFGPVLDVVMGLGMVGLLIIGGMDVLAGTLSLGAFVAFQRYIQKLIWPMEAIGLTFTFYQRAVVSQKRLQEVLREKSDVADVKVDSEPIRVVGPRKVQAPSIEFQNLTFAYPGRDQAVLKNVSFRIEAGESLAIVGPVASGKSTLLQLIPRLYPPPTGTIYIQGREIWDWPLTLLRREVAIVGQEVFLFSESVAQNIAEGSQSFTRSQIESVTSRAALDGDLGQWSAGLDTVVGEKGYKLSGGQRQRVGLARALIRTSPILLLDDIVSALDTQSAERIFHNLHSRGSDQSLLFSSHRVSAARKADRILVLVAGQIVEEGTHQQLLGLQNGFYRRICEEQAREEDLTQYVQNLSP